MRARVRRVQRMVPVGDQGAQDRLLHLGRLPEVAILHGAPASPCFCHRDMNCSLTLGMLHAERIRDRTGFKQAARGRLRAAQQDPCCGPVGIPTSLECAGIPDERRAGDLPRAGRRDCGDPQVFSVSE